MLEFSFIAADSKGVSVSRPARDPGRGVLPYIMYIGMCRPKGYGV